MRKLQVKSGGSKLGAFAFSKFLLGEEEEKVEIDTSATHEPPNKSGLGEMTIQSSILDHLLLQQVLGKLFVQRINNTPIYDQERGTYRAMPKGAHKGFPDIFVLKNSQAYFIEVKSGKGRQSKAQKEVEGVLVANGAEYYIVRTLEFVMKILE